MNVDYHRCTLHENKAKQLCNMQALSVCLHVQSWKDRCTCISYILQSVYSVYWTSHDIWIMFSVHRFWSICCFDQEWSMYRLGQSWLWSLGNFWTFGLMTWLGLWGFLVILQQSWYEKNAANTSTKSLCLDTIEVLVLSLSEVFHHWEGGNKFFFWCQWFHDPHTEWDFGKGWSVYWWSRWL